jgi:hypothetical protein
MMTLPSTDDLAKLDATTRVILAQLADELELARLQLESLADTLCTDADVVMKHIAALQTLDSVGQRQAAIAEIIRAGDIVATAQANPLEAIMRRLVQPPSQLAA